MKKPDINKMLKFDDFLKEQLKDPAVKKAYDDLEFEDRIIRAMIDKRIKEKLTQKQLAERLGTTQSALARFESGRVSPRLDFIKKITQALGLELTVSAKK